MPIVYLAVIIALYATILWKFPQFRLAGGIMGVLIVGGVTGYLVLVPSAGELQGSRISASELRLEAVSLEDNGRSLVLSGRVENLSENFVLRDMTLRVRLYDCPSSDSELNACEIVGDDEGIARATVPPGQVREFSAIFYYPGLPDMRGEMRWQEDILTVRATEERL